MTVVSSLSLTQVRILIGRNVHCGYPAIAGRLQYDRGNIRGGSFGFIPATYELVARTCEHGIRARTGCVAVRIRSGQRRLG